MSAEVGRYQKIFENWEIEKEIGRGTDGVVYEIVNKAHGFRDTSALKIIILYEQFGRKEWLIQDFLDEIEDHMDALAQDALKAVALMQKLRGNTNIVDYLDYEVDEWEEKKCFGSFLLIRMELLHNLAAEQQKGKRFTEREIIQLGKDICNALVLCHSMQIIHSDIKPANIYWNDNGSYKLGDFGISRIIDDTKDYDVLVGRGTKHYMAPEQYGSEYDFRGDIYSLGLVLYELGNANRLPFAKGVRATVQEVQKRIMGNAFPAPMGVSNSLAQVIMKACAYKPEERYQTAQDFLAALCKVEKLFFGEQL